jgi:hypothetical protein
MDLKHKPVAATREVTIDGSDRYSLKDAWRAARHADRPILQKT